MSRTVTFDTNVFPAKDLIRRARAVGYKLATVSVTHREAANTSFVAQITELDSVAESFTWGETAWGQGRWSGKNDAVHLEKALQIISNGSFPPVGKRKNLSKGETNTLRDALIFTAHVRKQRAIFVTEDRKAFVKYNRRDTLEREFGTKILTIAEFQNEVEKDERNLLLPPQ